MEKSELICGEQLFDDARVNLSDNFFSIYSTLISEIATKITIIFFNLKITDPLKFRAVCKLRATLH